jgi:hypothetical protein
MLQVVLKAVYIWAQWGYPIGIECFLNILLFHARFAHMSQTQIYHFTHCFLNFGAKVLQKKQTAK